MGLQGFNGVLKPTYDGIVEPPVKPTYDGIVEPPVLLLYPLVREEGKISPSLLTSSLQPHGDCQLSAQPESSPLA